MFGFLTTVDTRVLAEKFMPKNEPPSLWGRLIHGSVFEVVYFYFFDDTKCVKIIYLIIVRTVLIETFCTSINN